MFNIAQYLFKNKLLFNLLVILQLSICLSFTNYGYTMTNSFFKGYNTTYQFKEGYLFSSMIGPAYKSIFDISAFEEKGNTLESCYYPIEHNGYTVTMFGEKTFNCYTKKLVKGKFEKGNSDTISCFVVGAKSYYQKTIVLVLNEQKYKFYVCGILDKDTKNIATTQINQNTTPDKVFVDFNNSVNIVCLDSDMQSLNSHSYSGVAMVYFGENEEEGIKMLSKYGYLSSMQDFRNTGDTTHEYIVKRALSHISRGTGVIGIISMVCMFVLNIKDNENMFRTFKLVGIKKKHLLGISTIYMCYFNGTLFLVTIPLIYIWKWFFTTNADVIFGLNNIIFTVFMLVLTYIINFVCSYYILFKKKKKNE